MSSFQLKFVDVASFSTPNWLIIWGGIFGTSNLLIKIGVLFLITLEIKAIKNFLIVVVITKGQVFLFSDLLLSFSKRRERIIYVLLALLWSIGIPYMSDAVALWLTIVTLDALYLGIRYKKLRSTDIWVFAVAGESLVIFMRKVLLLLDDGRWIKQMFVLAERLRHFCIIYFLSRLCITYRMHNFWRWSWRKLFSRLEAIYTREVRWLLLWWCRWKYCATGEHP